MKTSGIQIENKTNIGEKMDAEMKYSGKHYAFKKEAFENIIYIYIET